MNCLHIALLISSYLVFSVDAESSDTLRYQEKTKCKKFNAVYEVDQLFNHPTRKCIQCRCCKTGKVKCFKKPCADAQPPKCGILFQEAVDIDGCCTRCNSTCVDIKNNSPVLNCPGDIVFYDNEDTSPAGCTGVCGGIFRGSIVPNGPVTDPKVVHSCESCVCANGKVTCDTQASCPAKKLECVNPQIDDNTCQWGCPEGPTCWKGDEVLYANMTYEISGKFCTCVLDPWWPFAACGNQGHEGVFEKMLQEEMCVKTAINPINYNPA